MRSLVVLLVLLFGVPGLLPARGEGPAEFTAKGRISARQPSATFTLSLEIGQTVVAVVEALTGDLDTHLQLFNPIGTLVAQNDDRAAESLDSALGYSSRMTGEYRLVVSASPNTGTTGSFKIRWTIGDETVLASLEEWIAIPLSGSVQVLDTARFRVRYTLDGEDATTPEFARAVADALEQAWTVQIDQLGWPAPISDAGLGGDSRLDVYVMDLLDSDGLGAMGLAESGSAYSDHPLTPTHEKFGSWSRLLVDNDFSELEDNHLTPLEMMKLTIAHEFHHAIQQGFDAAESTSWLFESTSAWIEQTIYPDLAMGADYVQYNFQYPELCFGTETDPSELMVYGEWVFLQTLVDKYGPDIIRELWDNIAVYDGFRVLERTLAAHGDTIPAAIARYRLRNLARDYRFADQLAGETVWLEGEIAGAGRWPSNAGVQQLGANYYALRPPAGLYEVALRNDDDRLEVWGIGVGEKRVSAFRLGRSGLIDTRDYRWFYLMIFNPAVTDTYTDCPYQSYDLLLRPSSGQPAQAAYSWSARQFLPLPLYRRE